MIIIFYGPEGSGKSTQAKKLAERQHLPYISTGDMVRYYARTDHTKLGRECGRILKDGVYLPDRLTYCLLRRRLKRADLKHGFILDGFPRNLRQAKFLDRLLSRNNRFLNAVFFMVISREACIGRVMLRRRDNHDTMKKLLSRMASYYTSEASTLKYYRRRHQLYELEADQPPEAVFAELLKKYQKIAKGANI